MNKLIKFFFSSEGTINKYQFNMGVCGMLMFTMLFAPALFEFISQTTVLTFKEIGVIADENLAFTYLNSIFFWVAIGMLYYSILVLMKKRFADLKIDKTISTLLLAPFVHHTWSTLYDKNPSA